MLFLLTTYLIERKKALKLFEAHIQPVIHLTFFSSSRNLASQPLSMKKAIFLKPQTAPYWRNYIINMLYVKTFEFFLMLGQRIHGLRLQYTRPFQCCWPPCLLHFLIFFSNQWSSSWIARTKLKQAKEIDLSEFPHVQFTSIEFCIFRLVQWQTRGTWFSVRVSPAVYDI